jgi:NADPH:quinone reductase-like Zn-dependent oxidoreductase
MKALLLETTDGPEAVRVGEVPTPEAQAGEVRVAIKAASMNHREMWIARGLYPGMALPSTMGCDGAGVVDQVGAGVSGVVVGDEVVIYPGRDWGTNRHAPHPAFGLLGMPHPGTIAEYVCVPAENIAPKPKGMSWEEAAATVLTGLTAWRALMFKGQLQSGETVLISGVGGGVATFGLAFAVALGAKVYVTGESQDVLDRAMEMGALGGLLYTDPDWRKQVSKLTGGIDVVLRDLDQLHEGALGLLLALDDVDEQCRGAGGDAQVGGKVVRITGYPAQFGAVGDGDYRGGGQGTRFQRDRAAGDVDADVLLEAVHVAADDPDARAVDGEGLEAPARGDDVVAQAGAEDVCAGVVGDQLEFGGRAGEGDLGV